MVRKGSQFESATVGIGICVCVCVQQVNFVWMIWAMTDKRQVFQCINRADRHVQRLRVCVK